MAMAKLKAPSTAFQVGFGISLFSEVSTLSKQDGWSYVFSFAGLIDTLFSSLIGAFAILGLVRLFQWVSRKFRK